MESILDHGYEDERFESVVDEYFHCPICMNVLKEPVMCQNNQHYFCTACITRYLKESEMCLTCREELSAETVRQPPRILMNCLSNLNIRCNNYRRGCLGFVKLGDLKTHLYSCGFAPVKCSNDGCSMEINKRDRIHHETEVCEFRKVKCHDCDEMRKEIEEVKMNLKEIKDNQEEIKKELKALAEVKDMLEQIKEVTNNLKQTVQAPLLSTPSHTLSHYRGNVREDIIIAGGEGDNDQTLNSVEMFKWPEKTWVPLEPMKQKRSRFASFVHKNTMFVAGGETEDDNTEEVSSSTYYDLEQIDLIGQVEQEREKWIHFPAKLPHRLTFHKCVIFQSRLIVIGGLINSKNYSDGIYEVLLIPPYTSKLLSRLPQPRAYHSAERFNDNILITGGITFGTVESVVLYNVNDNTCKQMPPLPFALDEMATVTYGDNIILIGGADKDHTALNTVIMYNGKTGKSRMLPSMNHKREGCTAVITGSIIVVMGGRDDELKPLNSAEYFSFDTYSWKELPPMREARWRATSVVKMPN